MNALVIVQFISICVVLFEAHRLHLKLIELKSHLIQGNTEMAEALVRALTELDDLNRERIPEVLREVREKNAHFVTRM